MKLGTKCCVLPFFEFKDLEYEGPFIFLFYLFFF